MRRNLLGPARLVLLALLTLCVALPGVAREKKKKFTNTSLSGMLYSTATHNNPTVTGYDAVEGAEITIEGLKTKTVSDKRGMFSFDELDDGSYTVVATKEGHDTVRKTVKVENGAFPSMVKMVMNPTGSSMVGDTPVGAGTVYVAFAARRSGQQAGAAPGFQVKTQQTFRGAVAAGADPLTISGNAPDHLRNPQDYDWNPTTTHPNNLMILPPDAPTRTGFHNLQIEPYWLCFNATGTILYLSNSAQQIQVLDARTNTPLRNLPVQGFVTDLRLTPNGNYVLAAVMAAAPGVMLIDTKTHDPVAFLPTPDLQTGGPGQPRAATMNRDGTRVYVATGDAQNGEVAVLDVYTGQSLGVIPVGANPTGMDLSSDGRILYVVNSGSADVSIIDAWSMAPLGRVRVGVIPQKVAVTPDGSKAFVTNKGSDSVSVLDGRTQAVVATVKVGKGPIGVTVTPDGSYVFVTCKDSGTVVRMNAKTNAVEHTTVPLPNSSPFGVAVKP